jgi:hypothetical protein
VSNLLLHASAARLDQFTIGGLSVAISKGEVIALCNRFHDMTMIRKGGVADHKRFFLYPDSRIYIPHGADLTFQMNYEIHQRLADEVHLPLEPWEIIPLCAEPERVRAVDPVYWHGRLVDSAEGALIKCVVGMDWVIQRIASGELKIVLYMDAYHHFLPDSAPIAWN